MLPAVSARRPVMLSASEAAHAAVRRWPPSPSSPPGAPAGLCLKAVKLTPCHLVAHVTEEPRHGVCISCFPGGCSLNASGAKITSGLASRIPWASATGRQIFGISRGMRIGRRATVSASCVPLPARLKSRRKCRPLFSICRFRYAVPDILTAVFFYIYVAYETK